MGMTYLGGAISENEVDLAVGYDVDVKFLFLEVLGGGGPQKYAACLRDFGGTGQLR